MFTIGNPSLSLVEALQLAGLLPCLFVVLLLCVLTHDWQRVLIPAAYFLCLACSFLLPLQSVLGLAGEEVRLALTFAETLLPALCFLLIIQFLTGSIPRPVYWLILAAPVIGGGSLLYSAAGEEELCIAELSCISAFSLRMLYNIFASSLIFLLLTVHFSRTRLQVEENSVIRHHKYWLVISLISLYLGLLALDLALLDGQVNAVEHLLAATVIRISFIYLVLTSLFRVFDTLPFFGEGGQIPAQQRPFDPGLIERLEQAIHEENVYREMGCSRESLAKHLGIGEHVLSRLVNQHYGKNFNEFINGFRVDEAKQRLRGETTPVTAIAFEVGFSSIASFNRVFKTLAGCSPTEYRSLDDKDLQRA